MYISNFKISQNFLQNKLVMSLKVYDQFGTPYTTSKTVASVVDETTSEFAAYKTAIEALHDLGFEKDRVTVLANTYKSYINPADSGERSVARDDAVRVSTSTLHPAGGSRRLPPRSTSVRGPSAS